MSGDVRLTDSERKNVALSVWSNTCNVYCHEEDAVHARECHLAASLYNDLADRDAAGVEALTLDRGALSAADLAYCEAAGSPANRVAMAIRAYLWAGANTRPHPMGTAYPSLNEWRIEAARIMREGGPLLASAALSTPDESAAVGTTGDGERA